MFVVVVDFEVKPETADEFRAVVLAQAENSLTNEPGCHVFDVAMPPDQDTRFLLYEIYEDEVAFQTHLKTAHFLQFDPLVGPMVISKEVQTYTLVPPRRNREV